MYVQYGIFIALVLIFCPFHSNEGESNEGGRCSVWPDNVKVFKGRKWESSCWRVRGLSMLGVCPLQSLSHWAAAAQRSDHAAVTGCRTMADLHTPSVPKRADVSLCQPPRPGALLRQLKLHKVTLDVHRWGLNYKQRLGLIDNILSLKPERKQKGCAEFCATLRVKVRRWIIFLYIYIYIMVINPTCCSRWIIAIPFLYNMACNSKW